MNCNSAQRSDQSENMSRLSSIPSLSSLCSSSSSSSSISCLGSVSWQYEPLKVDVDHTDVEKNTINQTNENVCNEILPDTSDKEEYDSDQRRVALSECVQEESERILLSSSGTQSIVPMFPSEVTVDDDTSNSSSGSIKNSELFFEITSRTNEKLTKPCLKQNLSFMKPTKFCQKRKREDITKTTSTRRRTSDKRLRVKLKPEVCIIPIPSRTEYSCHIKNSLWSSSSELYTNALRNSIEFAAEGWNWRKATEDDQMVVHVDSGELIHPVHIQNVFDPELGSDFGSDSCDSTNSQDIKN